MKSTEEIKEDIQTAFEQALSMKIDTPIKQIRALREDHGYSDELPRINEMYWVWVVGVQWASKYTRS